MNEQHQEVQVWLDELFGGDSVPSYELNNKTVGILYDLMKRNQQNEKDAKLIIEDNQQKSDEYICEATRIEKILQYLNLSCSTLSQSGLVSLRTLANISQLLDVKDTSDTSYMLGLQALDDEIYEMKEAVQKEELIVHSLTEKTHSAIQQYNNLKRSLDLLEKQSQNKKQQQEKKYEECMFLRSKYKEYKEKIQQYQNALTKTGVEPSLYHRELVKKSEELLAMKEKILPMKSKLETFHNLPPDISLTKVKIAEMRREVEALEADLCKNINMMHM